MKTLPLALLVCAAAFARADYTPPVSFTPPGGYASPFSLQFTLPEAERVSGWDRSPWNAPHRWGVSPSFEHWYDPQAYAPGDEPWGPASVQMPATADLSHLSTLLLTEKLFSAAQQYLGMHYQHHHIAVFDPYNPANYTPPPDWPWIHVASEFQGRGMDCSNFVSWVYNFALGIKLDGGVGEAAARTRVTGPGGIGHMEVQTILNTGQTYRQLVETFQPGDILYFHGDKDTSTITHSALWVGTMATDAHGRDTYFVLDSTGAGTLDSANHPIPDGAYLRPFNEHFDEPESWYFHQFHHAHRVIPLLNEAPSLRVLGRRNIRISHKRLRVRGTAASPNGIERVEYRVGRRGAFRVARGTEQWSFQVTLSPGRHDLQIRAQAGNGLPSGITTLHVTRHRR